MFKLIQLTKTYMALNKVLGGKVTQNIEIILFLQNHRARQTLELGVEWAAQRHTLVKTAELLMSIKHQLKLKPKWQPYFRFCNQKRMVARLEIRHFYKSVFVLHMELCGFLWLLTYLLLELCSRPEGQRTQSTR